MTFIETPSGDIYKFDDCRIFDDLNDLEVSFNAENQNNLTNELFENTRILVGELKGGENTG